MTGSYIIAFSSFYKASYAQERLLNAGIHSTIRRLPPELMRSCGYALYVPAHSTGANAIKDLIEESEINDSGIYREEIDKGNIIYSRI